MLFFNRPLLKHKLYSIGRQVFSVAGRLRDAKRAATRREAELYAQLGDLNHKLVEMEAAHIALQASLQQSRDEQARSQDQDSERIVLLQQQIHSLESQRDSAWRRVRELELSLAEAHSRQADSESRFDALCGGLERDRSALQTELTQAHAALARSRQEVRQLRAQGSRVLEAMRRAQRLADESGAAARELDSHLVEHSSRLLDTGEAGVGGFRGLGDAPQSASVALKSNLSGAGLLASRQLRVAASLPLLVGALVSAKALWDSGDETGLPVPRAQYAQQAGAQQGEHSRLGGDPGTVVAAVPDNAVPAAGTGQASPPVLKQARAALASMEIAPPAGSVQARFDPLVQRQQRDLLALGFDLGDSRADGFMGARTAQAFEQFESLYLPASGLHALSGDRQLASFVNRVAQRAREDAVRLNVDSEVLAAIQLSHMRTGVAFSYLAELAAVESRFDPATQSASSTATGLYQFTGDTWLQVLRAHGKKYGLADYVAQIEYSRNGAGSGRLVIRDPEWRQQALDLRYDARISALMAAEFASDNQRKLVSALGREVTPADLYFAHFLGVADAIAFLSLLQVMPDQVAGTLFPTAADANGAVFYPAGEPPRTVAEVYALFERKFNTGRFESWDLALMLAEAGQ